MKLKLSLLTASFFLKVYLVISSFIVFLFFRTKKKSHILNSMKYASSKKIVETPLLKFKEKKEIPVLENS